MERNHYVSATSSLNINRSTFDNPNKHTLTTFNAGEVVPIRVLEVIPGDTFNINVKSLVRALTPLNPTMTNMWVTICAIYTPYRVVDNSWYETLGENNITSWTASNYPEVPSCALGGASGNTVITDKIGSLGHHLGLPLINTRLFIENDVSPSTAHAKSNTKISALYKRTYCENWNEWWRDQNTQSPIIFSKELNESYSDFYDESPSIPGLGHTYLWNSEDETWEGDNSTSYYDLYSDNTYGCYLLPANKKHDYFTSAYPTPQKGEAEEFIDTFLPVLASDSVPDKYDLNVSKLPEGVSRDGMVFNTSDTTIPLPQNDIALGLTQGELSWSEVNGFSLSGETVTPVNLFAYTGNIATSTINKLRQSIAIQHWNEVSARGGSRRNEILEAHFHVKTNPLMLNKSRYLGGFEFRLSSQTAIATAESENYTVGSTGGYTAAGNIGSLFTSSFDEHGTIMIYAAIRTDQIYSQGIDKMFTRFNRFDFYWDEFKNLGAQPIYNKEIMLTGTSKDDEVFAYNDYADELRVEVNKVSGFLDPVAPNSLSSWTMANNFSVLPVYGPDFMKESKANIDRTLAVSSRLTDQFFADFCFDIKKTRILPLSSVPGLTRI